MVALFHYSSLIFKFRRSIHYRYRLKRVVFRKSLCILCSPTLLLLSNQWERSCIAPIVGCFILQTNEVYTWNKTKNDTNL